MIKERPRAWHDLLPKTLWAYRNSKRSAIGFDIFLYIGTTLRRSTKPKRSKIKLSLNLLTKHPLEKTCDLPPSNVTTVHLGQPPRPDEFPFRQCLLLISLLFQHALG
ncbi:unnamed protein product [Prunus brigantina]